MNKYIILTNKGEIIPEDLTLIGSSTKRGDSSKIGQFGSGWKYALAWIMRNDLSIRIFSGEREIKLDYLPVNHRGREVKVLTVDGEKTSITSGMGEIDWTAWMALREILSNAIDEGNQTIEIKSSDEFQFESSPGTTTIFLEAGKGLEEVMQNYQNYFTFDRPAIYENKQIRIFEKKESSGSDRVFRKDILCFEEPNAPIKGYYDYSFEKIVINESRLSSQYNVQSALMACLQGITNPLIQVKLLDSMSSANIENYTYDSKEELIEFLSPSYQKLIEEEKIEVHPKSLKNKLGQDLLTTQNPEKTVLFIEDFIYEDLANKEIVESIIDKYFKNLFGGSSFSEDEGVVMEIVEDKETNELVNSFSVFAYPFLPVKMKLVKFYGREKNKDFHFSKKTQILFLASHWMEEMKGSPCYLLATILNMGRTKLQTIIETIKEKEKHYEDNSQM